MNTLYGDYFSKLGDGLKELGEQIDRDNYKNTVDRAILISLWMLYGSAGTIFVPADVVQAIDRLSEQKAKLFATYLKQEDGSLSLSFRLHFPDEREET